jgi:hypothetical protein
VTAPTTRRPVPALTLARALWLCTVLLCAQWLGQAHAVAHGVGSGAGHTLAVHAQADGVPAAQGFAPAFDDTHSGHDLGLAHDNHHAPGLNLADGHEAGGAECRLVDQLGHADLLWSAQAPAGQTEHRGPAPQAWAAAPRAAAPAAAYQARAPPLHR